jgi:multiple sugar transport system ATP-binding protein
MAQIRFEGVSKRYGDTPVIERLDLVIADGEFFTFVGPSGCGKSTLLGIVAGIEPSSAGRLHFDGLCVDALPPGERDVAMVFQSYALYPHLSVRENLAFPLVNRRTPRERIAAEVEAVARTLGLEALLERRPKALSGGQRQRVALGRALIRRPKVFLMDEPLSNLDARLRLEMREELKRLHAAFGITTVYVTHDQEEALVLSDRIAVLDRGRVQQCGTPDEVYATPANRFVAAFIGSPPINLLDAELLRGQSHLAVALERFAGRKALAGVRPSDVAVHAAERPACLAVEVTLLEPTGSDLWVLGRWKGTRLKGRAAPGAALAPGSTAYFELPAQRLHVFDFESGARLG